MRDISENDEIKYAGEAENVNPKKEALTVEKLRTFEGFENTTEEEALEIIYTIDTLCRIVQEYLENQNMNENNNPQNLAA
ncbi:MAG: hypothetical protein KGJ07_06950 [Patescibacteria group bacterium]|nr:hypothetical protein [Patescibacteria group bacterium]